MEDKHEFYKDTKQRSARISEVSWARHDKIQTNKSQTMVFRMQKLPQNDDNKH